MRRNFACLVLLSLLSLPPLTFSQVDSSRVLPGLPVDSSTVAPDKLALPAGAQDTTSLSFRDTDIRDIFRGLSAQHGLNIFLDNVINQRVTISLNEVRVHDAILFLCQQNNLLLVYDAGIYRIKPQPAPEPIPPKDPVVRYITGRLFVDLKNDDLERVVRKIQEESQKNILILSGTNGTLSGQLIDIEFDLGFTQLMNNNGFAVQKKDNIYIVSRLEYFVGGGEKENTRKTGPYWVSVKDSLVTIDVTNAPIERVVTDMVRQLNTDIVLYDQLSGQTTVRATDIPLLKALDLTLRNSNFSYRAVNGVYFVGEKTNKALTETRLLRLKYLKADQVLELIPQSISSQAVVKVSKEHNGIVAIGSSDIITQMTELITEIDRPVAQVLIEAIVVDYDLSKISEFGISAGLLGDSSITRRGTYVPGFDVTWGGNDLNNYLKGAGSINLFGSVINLASLGQLPSDFYLSLKAMEQEGLVNIKSRPVIATLNGHEATLSIGTTQYFLLKTTTPYRNQNDVVFQESESFQTIQADVRLEITPYVGADGLITLDIHPDFKTPVGQLSPEVPPTINSRSLSSTVVVREGESIVLGGLVQESEIETKSKVPILGTIFGWIPILGNLFSSTATTNRKTELLIYVTPHISYGESFQAFSGTDR